MKPTDAPSRTIHADTYGGVRSGRILIGTRVMLNDSMYPVSGRSTSSGSVGLPATDETPRGGTETSPVSGHLSPRMRLSFMARRYCDNARPGV